MPDNQRKIQVVLAPAGAEYSAVQRGLRGLKNKPELIAIPAGPQGVKQFLQGSKEQSWTRQNVLLIGLGGSLSLAYSVGDGVIVEQVWNGYGPAEAHSCDLDITAWIEKRLGLERVVGVTCDRVITKVEEKLELGDRYRASIVDMEAAILAKALSNFAIVRVISDSCQHELPDISQSISSDGTVRVGVIALSFLTRPIAAIRLISGALRGLSALTAITAQLFKD